MTTDTVTISDVSGTNQTKGRSTDAWGARRVLFLRVVPSNSAPSTGYSLDPEKNGWQKGAQAATVIIEPHHNSSHLLASSCVNWVYDWVAKKLVPIDIAGGAVATGTDFSCLTIDVTFISE